MIETHQLTRRFGSRTAVEALTFSIPKGSIVGFLGPNGAGKSTTLKMLAGFLPPTSGSARIGGLDVVTDSLAARRLIGYMPESVPLHPEMRVREYLRFRAEIKGIVRQRDAAVDRALELADVADVAPRLIGELSKGYKQRVGLADALVARPPLLILDEPTEGLDPNQILRFRDMLKRLGAEHTIFLSTHIMQEVEAVCERVVIIHNGRIAADGPLEEVRAQLTGGERDVVVKLHPRSHHEAWKTDPAAAAKALVDEVEGLTLRSAAADGELVSVVVRSIEQGDAVESLVAKCVHAGLGVRAVSPQAGSLERVFHALTGAEGEA
ncbi:MAG: ABC transporter ATP-binding protein [Deltaproteobacteria bacterium]|nr:ABC transporter ATP-binding protein [Myxococcales bacterium]MDP3216117.1 ABC transporter ATP-binding protein [Deltaproteobacteria bacterium]